MPISLNLIKKLFNDSPLEILGVVAIEKPASFPNFISWLDEKKHASMVYLEKYKECRENPLLLFPKARSAIIVALPYFLEKRKKNIPQIAQYALLSDYHKIIPREANLVMESLRAQISQPFSFRIMSDSIPLLERALAEKCSEGFIGKNSLYIHPRKGSFLLLGEIFTDLELEIDQKIKINPNKRSLEGDCGSCKRCQVFCPTQALQKDYTVDARRCLSYYTIEHRGTIPVEFWPYFKDYWYGCDICQNVCPYNKNIEVAHKSRKYLKEHLKELSFYDVAVMTQEQYEKWFGGTPMTRAKRHGLQRNALIAMAVCHDKKLMDALQFYEDKEEVQAVVLQTIEQIKVLFQQDYKLL